MLVLQIKDLLLHRLNPKPQPRKDTMLSIGLGACREVYSQNTSRHEPPQPLSGQWAAPNRANPAIPKAGAPCWRALSKGSSFSQSRAKSLRALLITHFPTSWSLAVLGRNSQKRHVTSSLGFRVTLRAHKPRTCPSHRPG